MLWLVLMALVVGAAWVLARWECVVSLIIAEWGSL